MSDTYIYLVFSMTGTWLARLIRMIFKLKYVHTSISLDDSFTKMYSFGRINPDNPLPAVLRKKTYLRVYFKNFPDVSV